MSFDQTRDALSHARQFHRKLGGFYDELKESSDKERTRTLLDYLSRHEKYLDESLVRFEEEVSDNVLDTYFQYGSEGPKIAEISDFEIKPDMEIEDVIKVAMRFDDCLIEFYREMAQRAVSDKVKEVFENLLAMEENERMELSKQMIGLKSL